MMMSFSWVVNVCVNVTWMYDYLLHNIIFKHIKCIWSGILSIFSENHQLILMYLRTHSYAVHGMSYRSFSACRRPLPTFAIVPAPPTSSGRMWSGNETKAAFVACLNAEQATADVYAYMKGRGSLIARRRVILAICEWKGHVLWKDGSSSLADHDGRSETVKRWMMTQQSTELWSALHRLSNRQWRHRSLLLVVSWSLLVSSHLMNMNGWPDILSNGRVTRQQTWFDWSYKESGKIPRAIRNSLVCLKRTSHNSMVASQGAFIELWH